VRERFSCVCGPGTILDCSGLQEQDFSDISPAWSRWIAPGRIGFMSTERRDGRSAPTTAAGRRSQRHGSRLAYRKDRANRSGQSDANWIFPAFASARTAMAVRNTLRRDHRNQQHVRSYCTGSPPLRPATAQGPYFERINGYPPLSSAGFAPLHRTLPHVPAAFCCRTERYDGKGNLYLQHAA
jgi:hypothetical protein